MESMSHDQIIRCLNKWRFLNYIIQFKIFLLVFLMCFYSFSFAATKCPKNNNYVFIGDSTQRVQQLCGKPQRIENYEGRVLNEAINTDKLNYFINSPNGTIRLIFTISGPVSHESISGISENGNFVQQTMLCSTVLKINDNANTIKDICGPPRFVEPVTQSGSPSLASSSSKTVKMTEFVYRVSPALPDTVFVFKNDQLNAVLSNQPSRNR